MSCFVPDEFKHLKWHVLLPTKGLGSNEPRPFFEIAEWINNEANGPTEKGHWLRWGYCGDFPSLCHAIYIGPFPDQEMLDNGHAIPR